MPYCIFFSMYYLALLVVVVVALCTSQTIQGNEHQYINEPPTPPTASYDDVAGKTCEITLYPDLCMAVFQSFPGNGELSDLDGLAKYALKLASQKGQSIHLHIRELLNETSDGFVEQCLTDCSDNYKEAIDRIEDSLAALEYAGYSDVSTWLMAAMTDAESCEEGFNERPGNISPLSDMNTVFGRLCSVCASIGDLLAETHGTGPGSGSHQEE